MKKLLGLLVALIAAVAIYLVVTPSPIDPLAWEAPSPPPMTGVLEPNDTLMKAQLLGRGQVHGPEDTAVDAQGLVYSGLHDGTIVRIKPMAAWKPSPTPKAGRWAWTLTPPVT